MAALGAMSDGSSSAVHPWFERARGTTTTTPHQGQLNAVPSDAVPQQISDEVTRQEEENEAVLAKTDTPFDPQSGPQDQSSVPIEPGQAHDAQSKKRAHTQAPATAQTRLPFTAANNAEHTEGPNGRQKRRKLSNETSLNVGGHGSSGDISLSSITETQKVAVEQEQGTPAGQHVPGTVEAQISSGAAVDDIDGAQSSQSRQDTPPRSSDVKPRTPPKKMLKLNAGGTFGSPVKPKPDTSDPKPQVKRGRKKKSRIVICRYTSATSPDGLGQRIEQILAGTYRVEVVLPEPPVTPKRPTAAPRGRRTPKAAHPFFNGKAKAKPEAAPSPPRRPSAVTPGKLRAQAKSIRALQGRETDDSDAGYRSVGPRPQVAVSVPAAPWPSKESLHVRGLDTATLSQHASLGDAVGSPLGPRKMKRKVDNIAASQTLLATFQERLIFSENEVVRSDGFSDPPKTLRLPNRLLLSGPGIRDSVSAHLTQHDGNPVPLHGALVKLLHALPTVLTPYDHGRSEPKLWVSKYAPSTATEVLQSGPEASILREWISKLAVQAVSGAASETPKSTPPDARPKKRRRKKPADLDDFIVDSDDDDRQLEEIPSVVDDKMGRPGVRTTQRTVVCSSQGSSADPTSTPRAANTVLISGPHGCGKSAMVYAIAKESGFEIFEINAGTRRSGRDIMDRVGSAVENHLMQHKAQDAETSADEDASRHTNALKQDLESGRQFTMNSFFKSKPASKAASTVKGPKPVTTHAIKAIQKSIGPSKAPRSQKQSLILLEDVDVLFEEDKAFWTNVLLLILGSKRPVVLTCTDESLVPMEQLTLHAILRLSSPTADLAVDYMLLVAASEGHLLTREAVATLYDLRKHDLRGSLMDLQAWCQMGVGDPRGGLGWLYQRWPAGTGVDEAGNNLRVISEHTYKPGMGNVVSTEDHDHEERMLQAWDAGCPDPRQGLFEGLGPEISQSLLTDNGSTPLQTLTQYQSVADTLSCMDVFSRRSIPEPPNLSSASVEYLDRIALDTTQPHISDKARLNYIEGRPLLQTDEMVDYAGLDARLIVEASSLLYKLSNRHQQKAPQNDYEHWIHRAREQRAGHESVPLLTRSMLSAALDPISESESGPGINDMAFEGSRVSLATDIAPYVRNIVRYDLALEERRLRLSDLLHPTTSVTGKRGRTTRAARSALEGSQRQNTRRDRWFGPDLDYEAVLATGGRDWPKGLSDGIYTDADTASFVGASQGSMTESMDET